MVEKYCPVMRAAYGFGVPVVPRGLSTPNGQGAQIGIQQVNARNHELRVYGNPNDYMMYCVYCGELAKQLLWNSALSRPDEVPAS